MKRHISKMQALAAPDAYPALHLEGRIAFRTQWAMASGQSQKLATFGARDKKFELDYDEEYNFAHKGVRLIDDPDWGLPKKKEKAKPSTLSPEVMRLLTLMREAAKNDAKDTA